MTFIGLGRGLRGIGQRTLAAAAGLGGGLGGGLAHLAFKLRGERVKFIAGLAEGVGIVAQDAVGRLLDALRRLVMVLVASPFV